MGMSASRRYYLYNNLPLQEGCDETVCHKLPISLFSDPDHIVELLLHIKAGWINKISDFTRENSNWGIEYSRQIKCKDCKKEFDIGIPTNPITFFT